MVIARRASYSRETLARQVIPLALGYRTALSSRPDIYKILYVRAIKRLSLTVSFVVLYLFACRRKFQFLPGCFLLPVWYQ